MTGQDDGPFAWERARALIKALRRAKDSLENTFEHVWDIAKRVFKKGGKE
jgi:hypothetical protein